MVVGVREGAGLFNEDAFCASGFVDRRNTGWESWDVT